VAPFLIFAIERNHPDFIDSAGNFQFVANEEGGIVGSKSPIFM